MVLLVDVVTDVAKVKGLMFTAAETLCRKLNAKIKRIFCLILILLGGLSRGRENSFNGVSYVVKERLVDERIASGSYPPRA